MKTTNVESDRLNFGPRWAKKLVAENMENDLRYSEDGEKVYNDSYEHALRETKNPDIAADLAADAVDEWIRKKVANETVEVNKTPELESWWTKLDKKTKFGIILRLDLPSELLTQPLEAWLQSEIDSLTDYRNHPLSHPPRMASETLPGITKEMIEEGVKVEMEHTDNEDTARQIAVDHLAEETDYYKKLKKVEAQNLAPTQWPYYVLNDKGQLVDEENQNPWPTKTFTSVEEAEKFLEDNNERGNVKSFGQKTASEEAFKYLCPECPEGERYQENGNDLESHLKFKHHYSDKDAKRVHQEQRDKMHEFYQRKTSSQKSSDWREAGKLVKVAVAGTPLPKTAMSTNEIEDREQMLATIEGIVGGQFNGMENLTTSALARLCIHIVMTEPRASDKQKAMVKDIQRYVV
jgi:hypothetical protein